MLRRLIIALSISVFMVGISLGGIVPWIALKQDMLGTDAITIGIIVAAQPLGIMLVAPLVSRIASSMGLGLAMVVFSIGTLPGLVLLPLTDSNALWIVFRLIGGLATAVPWVLGETWINMATKPKWRARTMGMYGAARELDELIADLGRALEQGGKILRFVESRKYKRESRNRIAEASCEDRVGAARHSRYPSARSRSATMASSSSS